MELGELCKRILEIFGCDNVSDLSSTMKQTVLANDKSKYQLFSDAVNGDLQTDWLQKIFQYYEADRKEKKQDYTPKALAESIAMLSECDNEVWCLDMCAGSGALTIQKWNSNNDIRFVCWEFDDKVIPYLLFNLAVRNITAIVQRCDVLDGEVFENYKITSGKDFSDIAEVDEIKLPELDTCISNPPYNIKWQHPIFAQMQPRFADCELPPESNANYAFILTAIEKCKRVSMIMPTCILSTDNLAEKEIREYLLTQNLIESVVTCPDRMFESTSIGTCLITFSKKKQTQMIEMVDMRQKYTTEIREQNGQFGGASHTGRTYTKEMKTFSAEQRREMLDAIKRLKNEPGFCKSVSLAAVKDNECLLVPSRYIDAKIENESHRPYAEIIKDLNRVTAERNQCRLVINETIAKRLGVYCVYDLDKKGELPEDFLQLIEKISGEKIMRNDSIRCTKNKNELTFQNGSKDELSFILRMVLRDWKNNIIRLNEQQNIYFAELRDALLPDLMSGKIQV